MLNVCIYFHLIVFVIITITLESDRNLIVHRIGSIEVWGACFILRLHPNDIASLIRRSYAPEFVGQSIVVASLLMETAPMVVLSHYSRKYVAKDNCGQR